MTESRVFRYCRYPILLRVLALGWRYALRSRRLSRNAPSSHVRYEEIGFDSIDGIRDEITPIICGQCDGWAVLFCMKGHVGRAEHRA